MLPAGSIQTRPARDSQFPQDTTVKVVPCASPSWLAAQGITGTGKPNPEESLRKIGAKDEGLNDDATHPSQRKSSAYTQLAYGTLHPTSQP